MNDGQGMLVQTPTAIKRELCRNLEFFNELYRVVITYILIFLYITSHYVSKVFHVVIYATVWIFSGLTVV